jgi:hypothetical protein
MIAAKHKLWAYCLAAAVAMSLGWGLRGSIGGGPLGAMIPGAMVALLLSLILGLDKSASAALAAFGAVGVGFGGQMTYGQTIGFILQPDTFSWGLLGLSVKGGIWGFSGGTVLGLGFVLKRLRRRDVMIGLALLLAGTVIGWKWINEPRLIYFSNPLDKPRPEIWAGLLAGTLFLLGYLAFKRQAGIPLAFALWGALGGTIGFGGGGLWMPAGKWWPGSNDWISWWKLMELTFGFCFGLALGYAAWRTRERIQSAQANPLPRGVRLPTIAVSLTAAAALCFVTLWLDMNFDIVWAYTLWGVALLAVATVSDELAWQVALTVTFCAFAFDVPDFVFAERKSVWLPAAWGAVAISTLAAGYLVARRERSGAPMPGWSFLALTWSAVVVFHLKVLLHPRLTISAGIVALVFILDAGALTWFVVRNVRRKAVDGDPIRDG